MVGRTDQVPDAHHLCDAEPRGLTSGVSQQRRLSDPGFAPQYCHATATITDRAQEAFQNLALASTA